jgi:hypothetical protein
MKHTHEILSAAIEGFELQKKRLDDKITEIRQMLGGGSAEPTATQEAPVGKRKKFSGAARKKMAMAQKARWAKIKGENEPSPVSPEAPKVKRTISADGLKRIAAAQRQRWAAKKAAEAAVPAKKAVVKKSAVKAPSGKETKKVRSLKKPGKKSTAVGQILE